MFWMQTPKKNTAGYSLIELLVTTIIFSVGMLGFGILQLESLKKSSESHLKSIASLQAADIIDRLKANPEAIGSNYFIDTKNKSGTNHLECLGGIKDAAYQSWTTGDNNTTSFIIKIPKKHYLGFTILAATNSANTNSNSGNIETSCDSQKMAETDLYQWKQNLSSLLPNGKGDICKTNNVNSSNCNALGDIYVITISWTNKQGETQQYRVGFTP